MRPGRQCYLSFGESFGVSAEKLGVCERKRKKGASLTIQQHRPAVLCTLDNLDQMTVYKSFGVFLIMYTF